jgi:hypothetical protein
MAAPITHIVLAKKVFNKYFSDKNLHEFLVGTSFPDIRYLRVIDREKTHPLTTDIRDCMNASSFESGFHFHVLVDLIRENHMKQNNVYELLPESKYITQALKFYEDQVLYDKEHDWNNTITFFDSIILEEYAFGIPEQSLQKWHQLLKNYFSKQSEQARLEGFAKEIWLNGDALTEIITIVEHAKSNQKVIGIINNFYNTFEV